MIELISHFVSEEDIIAVDVFRSQICMGTSTGNLINYDLERSTSSQLNAHSGRVTSLQILTIQPYVLSSSLDGTLILNHFPFNKFHQKPVCIYPPPFDPSTSTPSSVLPIHSMAIDESRNVILISHSSHPLTTNPTGSSTISIFFLENTKTKPTLKFSHTLLFPFPPPVSLHFIKDRYLVGKFLIGRTFYSESSLDAFYQFDTDSILSKSSSKTMISNPVPQRPSPTLHALPPLLANAGEVPAIGGILKNHGFVKFSSLTSSLHHNVPFPVVSMTSIRLPSGPGLVVAASGGKRSDGVIGGLYCLDVRNGLVEFEFKAPVNQGQSINNLMGYLVKSTEKFIIVVAKLPGTRKRFICNFAINFSFPVCTEVSKSNLYFIRNNADSVLLKSIKENNSEINLSISEIDPVNLYLYPQPKDKFSLNSSVSFDVQSDFYVSCFIFKENSTILACVYSANTKSIVFSSPSKVINSVFCRDSVKNLVEFQSNVIAIHESGLTFIDSVDADVSCKYFQSDMIVSFLAFEDLFITLRNIDSSLFIVYSKLDSNKSFIDSYQKFLVNIPFSTISPISFAAVYSSVFGIVCLDTPYIVRRQPTSSELMITEVKIFPHGFCPSFVTRCGGFLGFWSNNCVDGNNSIFGCLLDMLGSKVIAVLKSNDACIDLYSLNNHVCGLFQSDSDSLKLGIFSLDHLCKRISSGRSSVASKFTNQFKSRNVSIDHLRLVPKTLKSPLPLLTNVSLPNNVGKPNKSNNTVNISESRSASRLLRKFEHLS
ncbi:hypothetical protein P9112_000747 [Eukaryota sp. TZLM1-RC]